MDRFFGRYEHSLDGKGRLILPARLRKAFEEDGGFLSEGYEGCIVLWPRDRFFERVEQLEQLVTERDDTWARAQKRLFASSEQVIPDVQGRIPIGTHLLDFAGLDREKVLVLGANRVVELWNPHRWAIAVKDPGERQLLGTVAAAAPGPGLEVATAAAEGTS